MQSENRFFDDLSKIINGAAGTVAGVGREFESNARERAREWIGGLDFVSREEFEAVKAMAAQAREQVEALEARLAALEGGAPKAGKPSDKAAS
ncbi:BMFP domain-containing protein YqiC [Sphingobium sp. B1D7B]|uniref:accessory factor UbiK family protein n=1 Tax=unclassified Sphingobium TaxID=2611147 RepID=UPI002225133C|nr:MULTISPECIES: accessory factor UbiK family protein [unclassified Sphingobium]MCW2350827.1 BMFP domain-containing protein YqiC [Sphingobium sp. B12D2B]MCW2388439.1 BMFP domain-containing protein YqiC [Sphingobium sp. B11D3B]MCW2390331.1 BMFP domain-containing protein YqiC [Sphingobium sp. B11D3A]MCW2405472.1 BMFP domain-containing protein YqiC [Sphingobium sp. B1D7B]